MRVKVADAAADRHVILMEADDRHPTDNHEIFIVGYPGEKNEYDVGDTPGVRAKIASGELVEVGRMQAAEKEPQSGTRAAETKK
jgi:ribosomal protein S12